MPIDRAVFAEQCVREGVFFAIEPHYMLAVAQLRSGISDGSSDGMFGPFRLKQVEWDANSQDDEFDIHFTPDQINSPSRQCGVFGLMAYKAFEAFVSANNRAPSSKELYLKQWPDAATATLAADFQKAFDDTATLIAPAAEAVLDDPKSIAPVKNADQTTSGPPPKFNSDPIVPQVEPAAGGPRLTLAMLQRHWGSTAKPEVIQGMAQTADVLGRLGINTPLRLAHFMAQISAETGNGKHMVESLNYRAERIPEVWPKRFPTVQSALPFAHNERALGNKVYNGRMGNQINSDDGFNFRGRGCIQMTGRASYDAIGKSCGLDLVNNPDLAIDPKNVLLIAATEFVKLGCLVDADRDNVIRVSSRINLGHPIDTSQGINGFPERKAQLKVWKQEFGVA